MPPVVMYAILLGLVVVISMVGVITSPDWAINIIGFGGVISGLIVIAMQSALAGNKVATKVERVATVAAEQSAISRRMAGEITATHTLVNSSYGASLRATLNALKLVESLTTGTNAELIARQAVEEAQRQYDEHMAAQGHVDAGISTPISKQAPGPVDIAEKINVTPNPVAPTPVVPVTTITQSPGSMEVVVTDKESGSTEVITGDSVSVTPTEKPKEDK